MWKRFAEIMQCPLCGSELDVEEFEACDVEISEDLLHDRKDPSIARSDFNRRIESGVVLCGRCKLSFPILGGLPVMIPYITPAHVLFSDKYRLELGKFKGSYYFPREQPTTGEQLVMESFSEEWLNYDYDGVMWSMRYEDHERQFLAAMGINDFTAVDAAALADMPIRFLEIGCGLGITTFLGGKNFGGDAVGVDLSFAASMAARKYEENPFIHFVQASAFHLPLRPSSAAFIYSHGVLHHTYSTLEAFRRVSKVGGKGSRVYIWVYGPGSISSSLLRRAAYALEKRVRPRISQNIKSGFSRFFLSMVACLYLLVNMYHCMRNPAQQRYNYSRALHAARDRFTPMYAHRHSAEEVCSWFKDEGFESVEVVDWRSMPKADHENYQRNVGVRGRRKD